MWFNKYKKKVLISLIKWNLKEVKILGFNNIIMKGDNFDKFKKWLIF